MRRRWAVCTFTSWLVAIGAVGQTLTVPEVVGEFRIDGVLDEPQWQKALSIELPFEVEPGNNTPAPVRTLCLVLSTPHALLVAFRAYDPNPKDIRAHFADRDRLFRDDFVGFMLDTFNDKRRAYEFIVNPLGVQGDAIRSEAASENQEDFSFDATWKAAGRVTDQGYEVEMEIPFSALRFPAGTEEKRWGFLPLRIYPRSLRRQLTSVPLDRNNACTVCQFQELVGFASARPGRSLEVNPSFAAVQAQARPSLDEPLLSAPSRRGDTGISVLWGLNPNVSLAATVNPDFSQVEADAPQLTVNRTFALFYPEKRPFFLEGADSFQTPIPVVYTRTLADPQWGIKVMGKEGSHTLAILTARDEITNLLLPSTQQSSQTTLNRASNATIFRYRYDLGASSILGAVATDRQAEGYRNRVLGVDGLLRLSEADSVQFQVLRSSTTYPDLADVVPGLWGRTLSGDAWQLLGSHASRNWESWVFLRDVGEAFRADLGFLPQVGVRGGEVGVQRIFWGEEEGWYSRLSVGSELNYWEDQEGKLLNRNVAFMARYSGPLQSTVFLRAARFREAWQGRVFSGERGRLFANVRFSGAVTSSLGMEGGDTVDYENSRPGKFFRVSPGFTWNLGRHLYFQGDFTSERLTVRGGELYRALVAELRSWYHFTTRSYVRLILQHTHVDDHPELYLEPRDRRRTKTTTQLLFAYKLNPQSLFFLGYSTNMQGNEHLPRVTMGRTLFLKLSYNWLF
ncbi:MAG: DUF5916 domain-containing protein [Thermoanaerobaculum sp.]